MRFLLADVGKRPSRSLAAPRRGTHASRPALGTESRATSKGQELQARGQGGENAKLPLVGTRRVDVDGVGASKDDGTGLYWMIQGARDDAVVSDVPSVASEVPSTSPRCEARTIITAAALATPPSKHSASISASSAAVSKTDQAQRKAKNKTKKSPSSDVAAGQRTEIGAGRALFGGFVPARQAPAASLYDFATVAGDAHGDVSALGSIYGSKGGAHLGGGGPGGSTLESLDDARIIRQYTMDATTRAQRLGAEKRSSRVARSKRHG